MVNGVKERLSCCTGQRDSRAVTRDQILAEDTHTFSSYPFLSRGEGVFAFNAIERMGTPSLTHIICSVSLSRTHNY